MDPHGARKANDVFLTVVFVHLFLGLSFLLQDWEVPLIDERVRAETSYLLPHLSSQAGGMGVGARSVKCYLYCPGAKVSLKGWHKYRVIALGGFTAMPMLPTYTVTAKVTVGEDMVVGLGQMK